MYVATIPNRSSPPAILLRESIRKGKQVRSRTLANLTHWPAAQIVALRRVLGGETLVAANDAFEIQRSLPHGHVLAVLGTLRRLELDRLIASAGSRERDLVLAMIVARVIDPRSKLATARGLGEETAFSSLGLMLKVESADENELYAAMDWLLTRQNVIEKKLARRHLSEGTLVLFDVTSTWFEGRHCPLAQRGYSRDGRKDKLQIVFGLLCDARGCPVAVEVFEGNTADPKTLPSQVRKLRGRFGLHHVVLVGDRGMLTEARITQDLRGVEGLDWITALRAPALRALLEQKLVWASLFDERDLAEIASPDFPGERLIACRNPLLADERRRKREALLQATERELDKIVTATQRQKRPLRGAAAIGLRVGRVLHRFKMAKYLSTEITDAAFAYQRVAEPIAADAAIDGMYVIRTSLPASRSDASATVQAYKGLARAERAFRSLKTVDLKVRPIHHWSPDRVRTHVFLCMLAYYVEWHLRQSLASILFDDDDPAAAAAQRTSIVQPAQRSPRANHKAATRRTAEDFPVHSFQTLLEDLKTLTRNRVQFNPAHAAAPDHVAKKDAAQRDAARLPTTTEMLARPTRLQQRVFELLSVKIAM